MFLSCRVLESNFPKQVVELVEIIFNSKQTKLPATSHKRENNILHMLSRRQRLYFKLNQIRGMRTVKVQNYFSKSLVLLFSGVIFVQILKATCPRFMKAPPQHA
jgi:hypothetical protein